MVTGPTFESMFPYRAYRAGVWKLNILMNTVTASATPVTYTTPPGEPRNCLINSEPSAPDAADGP